MCEGLGVKLFGCCAKPVVANVIIFQTATAQSTGPENFFGALGQDKWFPFTKGVGSISLSNQEFNFISSSSTGEHEAGLAWINTPERPAFYRIYSRIPVSSPIHVVQPK